MFEFPDWIADYIPLWFYDLRTKFYFWMIDRELKASSRRHDKLRKKLGWMPERTDINCPKCNNKLIKEQWTHFDMDNYRCEACNKKYVVFLIDSNQKLYDKEEDFK